jgi:hypothetical protein
MGSNPNAIDLTCDWRFGANVVSTEKGRVGYLLTWSGLGGLNLAKDIEVWNPYSTAGQTQVSGTRVQCIGLIERLQFNGDEGDPIRIRAMVSRGTATNIRSRIARPVTNTKVKFAWYIIDFDEEDKLWYELSYVKTPTTGAEGALDSMGGELQIFVDKEGTVLSPTLDIRVFGFEFQMVPAEGKTSTLEFATGSRRRMVKSWAG